MIAPSALDCGSLPASQFTGSLRRELPPCIATSPL